MALALSSSAGIRCSSQSVAQMNPRPRPVHLKAFAPIYQPAPLKSGDLVASPLLTRFVSQSPGYAF